MSLDRCFFKALKNHCGEYCDQWLVNNVDRTIGQDNVAAIFEQAYNEVCTIEKAVNASRICGILTVDKFLFDEDFLPTSVTDQGYREEKKFHKFSFSVDL
ncbi:hypothetical protein HHI36_019414 [Cryptolaemus montrouzieri]|uniref:Uncharacterized protein n=1 Tax=Cryptolaemus montrouzieri TaxID=559131 RepID=A0ABD2P3Z0_9CUCU